MSSPAVSTPNDHLPYWLVNVPPDRWPSECPEYLRGLSDKDTMHLAVRDEDYHLLSWEEVRAIVESNRLDAFFRVPSELRRYRWYCWILQRDYGSVMAFLLDERLQWSGKKLGARSSVPFADPEDFKILRNDWPYGLDPRIVHLVVWTKQRFLADEATGEPTPEAHQQIQTFVDRVFAPEVPAEKLLWFKNPIALRSVDAVEHFHVLMLDTDPAFIERVTGGDVATCEKVGKGPGNEYM